MVAASLCYFLTYFRGPFLASCLALFMRAYRGVCMCVSLVDVRVLDVDETFLSNVSLLVISLGYLARLAAGQYKAKSALWRVGQSALGQL